MNRFTCFTFVLLATIAAAGWSQQPVAEYAAVPGTIEQLRQLPTFRNVARLEELHQAALVGKNRYRLLVNEDNFKALGLDHPADAANAEFGTPLKDYLVRLDQLKEYKSGEDAAKLLTDTGIVHYPLVLGGKTLSSLALATVDGRWEVVSIGDAVRSAKRSDAVVQSAKALHQAEVSYFTVRIPAFNLEFEAATDAAGVLQLTPIVDSPEWGLQAGVPQPAPSVFLRLVPAAKMHNGMPR